MNSKHTILSKIIDKYSEDNKTSEYDLNKDSNISDSLYKNGIVNGGKGFSCNCGDSPLGNGANGPLGNGGDGPLGNGAERDPIPNSPKYFLCNCGKGPNCFLCNCGGDPLSSDCPYCFLCNCRGNPNNNSKCYKDLIIDDE